VEFVAGGRALQSFQKDHALLKKLSRLYSALPEAMPEITEKLLQEKTVLSKEIENLRGQLLDIEARELLGTAQKTQYASTIKKVYTGRSLDSVKILAQKAAAQSGTLAILAISDASQIVVARSKDLSGSCNDAIKSAIAKLGGKGGGRPELAQAGGFAADDLDSWMLLLENFFLNC
jgi:alanyl-tRNA synthetase